MIKKYFLLEMAILGSNYVHRLLIKTPVFAENWLKIAQHGDHNIEARFIFKIRKKVRT
jgi:hypothetical protein